jgi:endo-1,4-beta-xylanase
VKASFCIILLLTSILQTSGQIADGKCKFLGNIIAAATPSDFTNYWNQVTPENAGKWGTVEATRDVMDWTQLDNAYNTAKSNNILFRQHTFVWGQQQPSWIASLTAAEQKEEIEEWIKAYCERYPQTDFIDVVNEPLHAVPAYNTAIGGSGLTGWDWVVWTFEKARQYCPNAKLFLNDYNIINNNGATTAYLQIINLLKSKNLIDGIGEQGHFMESTPVATLKSNLDRLAATQIPIHITEFDIHLADDTQQKNKYEELFPMFWTHPSVYGMTLWGYKQGQIWRENAYLLRANGSERPAMIWLKNFVAASNGGTLCSPVSVEAKNEDQYDVFPNPSHGKISVQLTEREQRLTIYDANGKVVEDKPALGSGIHDFILKAQGLYMIRVASNRGTTVKRVIIN